MRDRVIDNLTLVIVSRKITLTFAVALLLIVGTFQHSGCGLQTNSHETNTSKTAEAPKIVDPDLEKNRNLWAKSNITDYDMEISLMAGNGIGGPASPVLIEVRGGAAQSIEATRQIDNRRTEGHKDFETVEKMFDQIQTLTGKGVASANEPDKIKAGYPKVKVEYDEHFGYPKKIHIIWSLNVDSISILKIEKFTIVKMI